MIKNNTFVETNSIRFLGILGFIGHNSKKKMKEKRHDILHMINMQLIHRIFCNIVKNIPELFDKKT